MGAKFYRGSDKPKKIKKRLTQTRTWFRTLKWVACTSSSNPIFRPRPSHINCGPPFQGFLDELNRLSATP